MFAAMIFKKVGSLVVQHHTLCVLLAMGPDWCNSADAFKGGGQLQWPSTVTAVVGDADCTKVRGVGWGCMDVCDTAWCCPGRATHSQ